MSVMELRKKLLGIPGKAREVSDEDGSLTQALIERERHNENRKWWQPKMEIKGYRDPWED